MQTYIWKRHFVSPDDPHYIKGYSEGTHEYYINLEIKGNDGKINRLTDLIVNSSIDNCTDEFSAISEQIKYYKENPKGVEIMRSEYDERVNHLKNQIEQERIAREKAEERAKAAKEKAEAEEREKIFFNIETLIEFGMKGKEIENRLSTKLSMTAEEAKNWIKKYAEYKTNK